MLCSKCSFWKRLLQIRDFGGGQERKAFSKSCAQRKGLYFEMHHLEVMELFSLISDKFT